MRTILLILLLCIVFPLTVLYGMEPSSTQNQNPVKQIEYAGFHLGMDLASLKNRYPTSYQYDTGSYVIHVSSQDVQNNIYYIQIDKDATGKIEKIRLSFEIPQKLRGSVRGPSCNDIRQSLESKFGKPMKKYRSYYEENNHHEPMSWFDSMSELVWDCGEYAIIIRLRNNR